MSTESSSNMFSAVCKQEQSRLAVTPKKNTEKTRMQRRKLRSKILNKAKEMTVWYETRCFVLSNEQNNK